VREATEEDGDLVEFGQLDDEADDIEAAQPELSPEFGAANGGEDEFAEPGTQLDDVALKAAEIENEEDLGSAGESASPDPAPATEVGIPEVELVFHDTQDPFGDGFEEEEVVIDRYALLEAGSARRWPLVSSPATRELADALRAGDGNAGDADFNPSEDPMLEAGAEAWESESSSEPAEASLDEAPVAAEPAARAEVETAPEEDEAAAVAESLAAYLWPEPPPQCLLTMHSADVPDYDSQLDPVGDPDVPQYHGDDVAQGCSIVFGATADCADEATGDVGEVAMASSEPDGDDRDIIDVVDTVQHVGEQAAAEVGAARTREYRQLFAKLRHG
jgi:hypothetical protein